MVGDPPDDPEGDEPEARGRCRDRPLRPLGHGQVEKAARWVWPEAMRRSRARSPCALSIGRSAGCQGIFCCRSREAPAAPHLGSPPRFSCRRRRRSGGRWDATGCPASDLPGDPRPLTSRHTLHSLSAPFAHRPARARHLPVAATRSQVLAPAAALGFARAFVAGGLHPAQNGPCWPYERTASRTIDARAGVIARRRTLLALFGRRRRGGFAVPP
jgi:hypothetical protein